MTTYCEDCGCKVFGGFCTNCHEEVYIEEQYYELGEACPELIYEKAKEQREEVKRKKISARIHDIDSFDQPNDE